MLDRRSRRRNFSEASLNGGDCHGNICAPFQALLTKVSKELSLSSIIIVHFFLSESVPSKYKTYQYFGFNIEKIYMLNICLIFTG